MQFVSLIFVVFSERGRLTFLAGKVFRGHLGLLVTTLYLWFTSLSNFALGSQWSNWTSHNGKQTSWISKKNTYKKKDLSKLICLLWLRYEMGKAHYEIPSCLHPKSPSGTLFYLKCTICSKLHTVTQYHIERCHNRMIFPLSSCQLAILSTILFYNPITALCIYIYIYIYIYTIYKQLS